MNRAVADLIRHHERLGLSLGASPQEIRAAFSRLVKKHHPDAKDWESAASVKNRGKASEEFTKIIESYNAIKGIFQKNPPPRPPAFLIPSRTPRKKNLQRRNTRKGRSSRSCVSSSLSSSTLPSPLHPPPFLFQTYTPFDPQKPTAERQDQNEALLLVAMNQT